MKQLKKISKINQFNHIKSELYYNRKINAFKVCKSNAVYFISTSFYGFVVEVDISNKSWH